MVRTGALHSRQRSARAMFAKRASRHRSSDTLSIDGSTSTPHLHHPSPSLRRSLAGDIRNPSSAQIIEAKQQLTKLFNAAVSEVGDTEVRVALHQVMKASMTITTSLSDDVVCEVFMRALVLDGYGATCTVAAIGDKYTFTLEYPIEPAARVAAKTAEMRPLIAAANFSGEMEAAAANLRLRRLDALSVASVGPPKTHVLTRVTIVVKVLASRSDAYEWLQALIRAVQERAGSVTASMIRATLMAAPGGPWGL